MISNGPASVRPTKLSMYINCELGVDVTRTRTPQDDIEYHVKHVFNLPSMI